MSLGNLAPRLRLQCKPCGWRPPEGMQMEGVQLHFQVEHDTDDVTLDLVAVCACGATMELAESRPTGGGFKDYFRCPSCGNTGFVLRDEIVQGRQP